MFCVVRQYKMKPVEDFTKLIDQVRDGFLPIVSKAPGYVGYSVARTTDGDLVTTGFFQDRAGADESVRLAADWVKENLASAVDGPPRIMEGEVQFHERRTGEPAYGLLRRGKVQAGKFHEMVAFMRDKFVPMVSGVPGFVNMSMTQVGPDEFMTLSTWRDRDSAHEATRRATAYMQENAGHLVAGPPEMIEGELKLRHVDEAVLRP
ncbi:MAG TPA: hypothetical protein VFO29_02975 [Candidatus Rubrimentiphilum sp.]|nr:hypothetical protein [Candidatus Rubrimentiphilum sp.]